MSLKLILMRHAKSSWNSPGPDHDRPLNARGRDAALQLGDWLRAQGHLPDVALVSSAARTQETFARLKLDCPAHSERALYLAEAAKMHSVLSKAQQASVLMLGHNPGIAEFAEVLVQKAPEHDRFMDYPTGATLVVEFDGPVWANVVPHSGRVLDFVVPRELE